MANNKNSGKRGSESRQAPKRIETGIISQLPPELLFLNFIAADESWGLLTPERPRECAWKKLYIQRDEEDMTEFKCKWQREVKHRTPSQLNDNRTILDKTLADQVSMWKRSKGLTDTVVVDHACSGQTCTYYQIGDVFVCEKTGNVYVCDDTCKEVLMDPIDDLLVCTVSGSCLDRLLLPDETKPDPEQQQGGTTDEAEPLMGSGRFARVYLLGYNSEDE